jgi:hypothetical protein
MIERCRHTPVRNRQSGHTLIEVMVASTLFVGFVVGLYGATGVLFSLLDIQKDRTETMMAMNVVRTSLIADARGVSNATCIASDTLELSTVGGGPPRTVEYRTDGAHLVRWASADNKDYFIADGVSEVRCQTLGSGVGLSVTFGDAPDQFALYVNLLEL